jgi:hypothetical protein
MWFCFSEIFFQKGEPKKFLFFSGVKILVWRFLELNIFERISSGGTIII